VSGDTALFSERFTDALTYAITKHNMQARKGSAGKVAYVGHLLGVCSLVIEAGGNETQAIAALLHDAPEDQGGQKTLDEIRARFGDSVADIVLACTDTLEEEKPDWRARKQAYLDDLKHRDDPTLMVSLADKLFNARAILRDYQNKDLGEQVWGRFKAGRDGQLWYYGRLSAEFGRLLPQSPMTLELASIVAQLDGLVAKSRLPPRRASGREQRAIINSAPDPGAEPLTELDDLFGGVASRLGAEQPASVASTWGDEKATAVNNIMRLIGAAQLSHTLTRDGLVVVPAKDGSTDVALEARLLRGEEWIHVFVVVLIDLSDDPQVAARVEEFLSEGNRYFGAKFLRLRSELQVMADLPCEGLDGRLLLAVMRRLLAVVDDARADIEKIGAGRYPGGVFPSLGWPIERPLQLDGQ